MAQGEGQIRYHVTSPIEAPNNRWTGVGPERLALTTEETESVARWYAAATALYQLWLDSGEIRRIREGRLLDPNGQVTCDGLKLARTLSARIPTRLWLFRDTDDGAPTHCPICGNELDTDVKWGTGTCATCLIQV